MIALVLFAHIVGADAARVAIVAPAAVADDVAHALTARGDLSVVPRDQVERVLSANAAAGLTCADGDTGCWTKIAIDGGFHSIIVVNEAQELYLYTNGALVRKGSATNTGALPSAVSALFDPEPPPPVEEPPSPPAEEALPPPQEEQAPAPTPPAPAAPDDGLSPFALGAAGAGVVGVVCGISAGVVDLNLYQTLVDARDKGVRVDVEGFHAAQTAHTALLVCAGAAGAAAIVATTLALASDP